MTFKPVYKISETILHHLTTIAASASTVENAPLIPKWELSIRRDALLRNAHASTGIEGNPLSLEQVSDLAAGREVMVNRKAKAEVLNYLSVLEDIPVLAKKPFSEKIILDVHKRLTRDVLDRPVDSGAYRTPRLSWAIVLPVKYRFVLRVRTTCPCSCRPLSDGSAVPRNSGTRFWKRESATTNS